MRSGCACARRQASCAVRSAPISVEGAHRTPVRPTRDGSRTMRSRTTTAAMSRPMPEGDNVFRAATALRKALQDARVVQLGTDFTMRDLEKLGPDATTDQFDAAEAARRLRSRPDLTIGEALLLQRAMAGVGNVIKAEALFVCGQDPFELVGDVSDGRLAGVVDTAHRLLVANRESGPRTSRDALTGSRLWVYGRSGKPCLRCGT